MPDLSKPRSPSGWRRLLKTRVRRLTARLRDNRPSEYRRALREIRAIADAALRQEQP